MYLKLKEQLLKKLPVCSLSQESCICLSEKEKFG